LNGGATLKIGQQTYYYAKNTSGSSIPIGTPVMFTGTVGASGKLEFGLAVSDNSVPPVYMMGVTAHTIANNDFGYVTSFGIVRGFNTSGTPYGETWADGDLLYFDPATPGTWTNVRPDAPSIHVPVAVVLTAASGGSGSIFVRMVASPRLSELQDVEINGGGPAAGQVLIYDATQGRWENNTLTAGSNVSITNADGSITVAASDQYTGTVTSVDVSGGTTGLTFSGGPVTSSGTITQGGTLNVANGGTGATSLTSGYLLKGNGTSPLSASVIYDNGTNVGIGTSSPDQLLHLSANNSATLRFESTKTVVAADDVMGAIEWEGNDSTTGSSGVVGKIDYIAEDATPEYAMRFFTHDNIAGVADFAERLRITSAGSVGIGTSSPDSKVDIEAANSQLRLTDSDDSKFVEFSYSGGKLVTRNNSTSTTVNQFTLDESGRLGIGTISPSQTLQVQGTGYATSDFRAPIFYDSNDTAYYVDPAGTSASLRTGGPLIVNSLTRPLTYASHFATSGASIQITFERTTTNAGQGGIGADINNCFAAWNSSTANMFRVTQGGAAFASNSFRAPIFYDSQNTGYYVDPTGTSVLNGADFDGIVKITTGSASSANTTDGLMFDGNYTNGQYRHRFRKRDDSGGIPLYLDYAAGTANSYTELMKFGPNTADGSYLTVYGIIASNTDIRAPIFYDSDNTGYNLNASGGAWQLQTPTGYLRAGPMNTGFCHFNTDRARYYFDKEVQFDGGINDYSGNWRFNDSLGQHDVSLRAPIFYDSNDTGYYINPNATSNCSTLQAINLQAIAGHGYGYRFWASDSYKIYMSSSGNGTWGGRVTGETTSDYNMYFRMTGGTNRGFVFSAGSAGTTKVAGIDAGGIGRFTGSLRAPLFYDNNNTAYYADFGSTGSSIRTAGPVSVGTTSSAVQLTVAGAGGVDGIELQVDTTNSPNSGRMFWTNGTAGQGVAIYNSSGNMYLTTGATPNSTSGGTRMVIYSGNYVTASGSFRAPIFYDSNNTGYYVNPASESVLSTVTFFGELNLSAAGQTYVDHTGTIIFRNQSGYATSATLTTSGNFTATGNVTAYSDIRVKDNVKQIEGALDKVQAIRGVTYNRTDLEDTERRYGGVIAQEIEKVLPEAIFESDDRKAVDYNATIGLLIEAIKELKAEVETLKKG
jgi:hypothetical protein